MTTDTQRHKLMAILAADGVGFSRLMSLDDRHTVALLDNARRVFREQVEAAGGHVIDTAGDSVLAVFDTAIGAVQAAMAVQDELARAAASIPEDRRMPFRIGIHLGDVIEKVDRTVYGDGVNIAARLQGIAEPGGIAVSQAVHGLVQGRVQATFADIGEQVVKNIADPVRAFQVRPALSAPAVRTTARPAQSAGKRLPLWTGALVGLCAVIGVGAWLWKAAPAVTAPTETARKDVLPLSIVVLPFTNLTGDTGQAYFADGLTAALTADLTRIEGAIVVDSATAQSLKGKAQSAQQIGQTLGVRFVLQGNVQRGGNQVRINAQLADTKSNIQVWSDTFEGDTSDLFALQDQVTSRISKSMGSEMVVIAARESEKRKDNLQAADLLLRARALSDKPQSLDNWRQVEQLYRQALEVDPGNVKAKMGLALALAFQATNFSLQLAAAELDMTWSEARRLADEVNAVEPNNPDYYQVLAFHALDQGDFEAARRAAETLLRLEPQSGRARNMLASAYSALGRPDKSVELLTEAVSLTPKGKGFVFLANLGRAHLRAGNYKAAVDAFDRALELQPSAIGLHRQLAMALVLDGNDRRARAEAAEYLRLNPQWNRDVGAYRNLQRDQRLESSPALQTFVEEKEIPALRKVGLLD